MSFKDSLGFVEVIGLTTATEVADAMVKSAHVTIKTVCTADAGLISVVCQGDLASCQAAVDAGKAAAQKMGEYVNSTLIPRPYSDLETFVSNGIGSLFDPVRPAAKKKDTADQSTDVDKKKKATGKRKK